MRGGSCLPMERLSMAGRRAIFILLAVAVVPLGLATRRFPHWFPDVVSEYAGDVLWAVVAYLLVAALAPQASIRLRASATLGFALLVEFSQLWHPEWLDAIRRTTLGHLALGIGFEWSDLPCYTLGVALAAAAEAMLAPRCGGSDRGRSAC